MKMSHAGTALVIGLTMAGGAPSLAQQGNDAPSIAEFLKIRTPSQVRLAPNGDVYFRDWPEGVNQLFRRSAGAPASDQGEAVTTFPGGITRRQGFSISPDGRWVIVPVDEGGNEDHDLYLYNTGTGELKRALVDPEVKYTAQEWLPDSSGFFYTANDESRRDFFIYKYLIEFEVSERVWEGKGLWFVGDVTDDGAGYMAVNYRSVADSSLFHMVPSRGELTEITARAPGRSTYNVPLGYMPGGESVLVISDFEDDGVRRLYEVHLDPGEPGYGKFDPVFPDAGATPISGGVMNHDRDVLAVTFNEGGYGALRLVRLPDFEPLPMPEIEKGVIGASQIQGRTLVFSQTNANTPGLSFAYEIPFAGASEVPDIRPLSARMDDQPIDLSQFELPELITFESFDGLEVPAFLHVPSGFERGDPIPFVIQFHGGPEGQARPTFSSTIAFLVSSGYGVMVPNVRGSTGYGRAYHQMDNYTKRWDSVKDGAEAARWLVANGYAEAGKIAAYGGSYGGFMSVATVIEGADVFGASVNIVGLVNFRTFLERTRGYRRKLREAEYGPLSDPEFLESVSPLNRASEIKARMLIAHGLNDPRVPVEEAMQLAEELQKLGRDPELIFFHDEGHGFDKLDNRILFGERMVRFLDETIGPLSASH